MNYTITGEDLREHIDNNDGVCLACGAWTEGGVEPDAMGYECDECGKHRVIGAEQAVLLGKLSLDE